MTCEVLIGFANWSYLCVILYRKITVAVFGLDNSGKSAFIKVLKGGTASTQFTLLIPVDYDMTVIT